MAGTVRAAVTMRVVNARDYHEPRDALAQDWMAWFEDHDLVPILVPNTIADPAGYADSMGAKMLVLTGGNDFADGGPEASSAKARDRTEFALMEHATALRWPILGVCRGMHVVNAYFGGGVIPDLDELQHAVNHVAANHPITLTGVGRRLAASASVEVNSFHSQAVSPEGLATGLQVFAQGPDGLVEGIVHDELPIIGLQWHPERPHPATAFDDALLDALLQGNRS